MSDPIYHLAPAKEIRAGIRDNCYLPARLAEDGFVHCSAERETTLAVAADYYIDLVGSLMLLEIDPDRLTARCVFEPAAPIPGGGTGHLRDAELFPHIYGPVNLDAITGVAELGRAGDFRWPQGFTPIDTFLA